MQKRPWTKLTPNKSGNNGIKKNCVEGKVPATTQSKQSGMKKTVLHTINAKRSENSGMEKKVLDIINTNKSEDSGIGKTCLDTINTKKPRIVAKKRPAKT